MSLVGYDVSWYVPIWKLFEIMMQKKMFVLKDNYSFPCKVYCFSALMSFYTIKLIVNL